MQLDLIDAGILDYNFFWHTVRLIKGTLRLSDKVNGPKQEIVSVLKSYPVSNPDLGHVKELFTILVFKKEV